jgi:hypothetical protein
MNRFGSGLIPVPRVGFDVICSIEMCESESGKVSMFSCGHCDRFFCITHKEHFCNPQAKLFNPEVKSLAQIRQEKLESYFQKVIVPNLKGRGCIECEICGDWYNPKIGRCRCAA